MKAIDEITIYNPAGLPYIADDGGTTFPITDSCERTAKIMGEDSVRLVFNLKHKVTFDAFSFIEYNGQAFFLKERYVPKPVGDKEVSGTIQSARYAYDVKFVSVANMLDKFVCYRHVEVDGKSWNEPEININGTLETLYVIIMGAIEQAASRLNPSWFFTAILHQIANNGLATIGGVVQPNTDNVRLTEGTQLLTFNFSGEKIANVCTTVANNFTNDDKKDTEWYITPVDTNTYEGATLHFAKCVKDDGTARVFRDYMVERDGEYLAGELKSVDYVQEWSGIPEVIVPYGSDRNMSYRSVKAIDEITQMQSTFGKRLRLQPNKTGSNAYKFTDKDGKPVTIETDANGAIRNSLVTTGIEVVKFFDEIYPQCHFKVTSVSQKNKRQDGEIIPEYTVEAVPVDNDGNTINREDLTDNGFYPIKIEEATTLSVRFESGLLNGREFEIANKTSKDQGATTYSLKFTIVADGSIEDGTLIPSGNFIPRKDDTFALFNMKMPDVYVTYAELELAKRAYEELITLQSTRPEIKCESDETIFDEDIQFGDVLIVYSDRFDSDEPFRSRVISYSYKLSNPRAVTFNLASAIMQGTLSSMNDLIADVTHTAGGLEQRAINLSRRGWRDASEVASMLNSLTADVVLVGNGRYQFGYAHEGKGVEVVHSTVGDETRTTAIKISHGTIEHTQDPYVDWVSKGFWEVSGETKTTAITENGEEALTAIPDTPLYLYAVVNENDTLLVTELTSIAHDAEEDEDYLLMGILSSEFEGRRVFSRTNGYTSLEGGTITTEIIQDAGRNLIIDFQSNPPRIIARNGAVIIGNIKFKASDEMTAEEQLAALGVDVSNALSTAEQAAYMNMYDGGDISVSTNSVKEIALKDAFIHLATLGCNVKFTKVSETPLPPFSKSCIIAVKKGTDVSNIYLYEDNIYAYLNWGDEYTPTEECDFYVVLADKEYIRDYMIPNAHEFIAYDIREVWTISGINVVVRTSDAIQSAMQAIANEEDARTEALAAAVSNINGGIDELQKQIDGEVSSYFYDTAPIDEDETILTDIPPFNEWAENYILRAGVYVLKTGARNEFVNHIGDTYTNMEEYKEDSNGNTTTPFAGLSWRWCDATTVSPLPEQYITIRYTSNGSTITKQLHWHKIADSDAVKALQEAGRAQSTADGKSTTFVVDEPTNYEVGDLWILPKDKTVNGKAYKKGTILTANAESATFVASHWSEDVRYTDDTALENMVIGGRNLAIYSTVDGLNCKKNGDYGFVQTTADTNTKFDLKIQPYLNDTYGGYALVRTNIVKVGVYKFNATLTKDCDRINIGANGLKIDTLSRFYLNETIPSGTELVISLEITNITQGSFSWKNVMIAKGTKATDWTPAPEDVDAKVSALDYLKEALENDTDVTGGIVATTHIQLRDWTGEYNSDGTKKYKVNAGLSGLDDDNVLAWGGGDYEDAVTAAQNSDPENGNGTYEKKDGSEITTLIKKDGTGKIGIFRISDTQAVVKTNQGEVLIDGTDNNGGVYVKNKSGEIKAAIVNGKVEDYAPLEDEVIVSKNVNIKSDTYNNGVFAEGSSGTCTTSRSVTFNLKQHISVSEPCYCKVSVKVYGRLTQGFYNTEYKNSSAIIQFTMNGEAKNPLSNSIYQNTSGYAQNGISPDQYYMEISRPIQSTSGAMATYNNNLMYLTPNYNFEVKVDVNTLLNGAGWCLAKLTGDLTFVIEVTRLWSYGYEPKTIVSTDGVMSAYDNKNFFIVKNTSNGQKIYAKGLSNGAGREAGSGELYVTSSFVDAFVSFLDEFHAYVDHVRTIGSNAGNADAMQTKIKGIKNTLVDASGNRITDIIASS